MPTAQEIYAETILDLPASERLRLAALILNGLAGAGRDVEFEDSWSEEDIRDLRAYSLKMHEAEAPKDDPLA